MKGCRERTWKIVSRWELMTGSQVVPGLDETCIWSTPRAFQRWIYYVNDNGVSQIMCVNCVRSLMLLLWWSMSLTRLSSMQSRRLSGLFQPRLYRIRWSDDQDKKYLDPTSSTKPWDCMGIACSTWISLDLQAVQTAELGFTAAQNGQAVKVGSWASRFSKKQNDFNPK